MSKTSQTKRSPLFWIGVAFLIVCCVLYLAALGALFLPLSAGAKTAVVGTTIVVAEVFGILGTIAVGKETIQAFRAKLRRKRDKNLANDPQQCGVG